MTRNDVLTNERLEQIDIGDNLFGSHSKLALDADDAGRLARELIQYRRNDGTSGAVKGLEWESIDSTSMWASVPKLWLCYRITLRADRLKVLRLEMLGNRNEDFGAFTTWEKAQAAAQADFNARISSALAAPIQPVTNGWLTINDDAPWNTNQMVQIGGGGCGKQVLAACLDFHTDRDGNVIRSYSRGAGVGWHVLNDNPPTHWQPLPSAPGATS